MDNVTKTRKMYCDNQDLMKVAFDSLLKTENLREIVGKAIRYQFYIENTNPTLHEKAVKWAEGKR